jgi:type IX secretion system PorP/SprF family membrane protein
MKSQNLRLPVIIILISIFCAGPSFCQETDYGPGYQTMLINNPALTGNGGTGMLRMSYLNFYPGHGYNFHSVFSSYDSYFSEIHGGAGIYMANDYMGGIINDLRGGVSYSYFLQAEKNLFINAGLSASFYHRGFDFDKAVLPDEIDPFGGISLPSSEILENERRTVFDVGTGVVFIAGKYFGGLSINHLTQPDLGGSASADDNLKRKYFIHLAADYELNRMKHMIFRPLVSAGLQGSYVSASAGAAFEMRYFSASSVFIVDNNGNFDIQAGFSVKRDRLVLFYNYRFNVRSADSLLPFSLAQQAGLAFSLNNVEKRIKVRTINIPLL